LITELKFNPELLNAKTINRVAKQACKEKVCSAGYRGLRECHEDYSDPEVYQQSR
jgi:hypothetical protein